MPSFWAEDFYRLWIGKGYVTSSPFHSVAFVFQILLVSTATSFSTTVAQQILIGAGRVQMVAVALILGSALNLTFSVILIRPYGLAGMAAATLIASATIDLIAMPLMLQRVIGLSLTGFLRHSCLRPAATGLLQALLMVSVRLIGPAESFVHLVYQGLLAGAGAFAALIAVGLTSEDRQRLLVQPLLRLRQRTATVEADS